MRRYSLSCLMIFIIMLTVGYSKLHEPNLNLHSEDRQFIKLSEGSFVYYNSKVDKTEIKMTFSNVVIKINKYDESKIIQSDDFHQKYKTVGNATSLSNRNDISNYNNKYGSYLKSSEEIDKKDNSIIGLIILSIIGIILSFLVFKPSIIRELKILKNAIFPMHEEPYEPTDLNVTISHVTIILIYIVVIIGIISMINDIF